MPRERDNEIKVFITHREATCGECGEKLGQDAWVQLKDELGAVCLPSGDAALTRRSAKYSTLSAVVLRWSRARNRYERQGLLVEPAALEQAEQECLADGEARARRQEREAERRAEQDQQYIARFAARVRELYPNCPPGREQVIAEHACQKYSGRVGRSAAARRLDNEAVRLAVAAHVRHAETPYDRLLAQGQERWQARLEIAGLADQVLAKWSQKDPG